MNEARIKLAEAMGWKPLGGEWDLKGDRPAWEGPDIIGDFDDLPDPFTDANDDYAVLKWMLVKTPDASHGRIYLGNKWDYKIGDYARAACKVLDVSGSKKGLD